MLLKIHTVRFVQGQRTAIPDFPEHSRYGINVDSVWFMASKTQEHGRIATVPLASGPKRPVQLDADVCDAGQEFISLKRTHEQSARIGPTV